MDAFDQFLDKDNKNIIEDKKSSIDSFDSFMQKDENKEKNIDTSQDILEQFLGKKDKNSEEKKSYLGNMTPKEYIKDTALGTVETVEGLGMGLVSFLPSIIAKYGVIGGSKIQNALEKVSKNTFLEDPMKLLKQAQESIGIKNPKTPEEQALMGEQIADYIGSFGGYHPTSRSGKASLGLVGKFFGLVSSGAHLAIDPLIDKEKYPNANSLATLGVELPIYALLPGKIKKGYKGAGRLLEKVQAAKGKRKLVLEKRAKETFDSLNKELEDYINSPEGAKIKEALKPKDIKQETIRQRTNEESKSFMQNRRELKSLLDKRAFAETQEFKFPGKTEKLKTIKEKPLRSGKKAQTALERQKELDSQIEVKSIWNNFLKPIKNERGSIDLSFMQKRYGKAPKGLSLRNKLLKEGINSDDLFLSGLDQWLNNQGQKRISWKAMKKFMSDKSFEITKKVLLEQPKKLPDRYKDMAKFFNSEEEALKEFQNDSHFKKAFNETKYKEYIMPGRNKEYKETLYKYNPKEEIKYNEEHWNTEDKPKQGDNVFIHDRRDYRKIVDEKFKNKSVVFLEELQSKWHDKGSQEGYKEKFIPVNKLTKKQELNILPSEELLGGLTIGVPNAPFKKSWYKIVGRDLILDAIKNHKDGIAWTPGKIHENRWKTKTNFKALYDKKLKKFFKKESGVEPKKVFLETLPDRQAIEIEVIKLEEKQRLGILNKQEKRNLNVLKKTLNHNPKEFIWYIPITNKIKKNYSSQNTYSFFDHLLKPLIMNESGAITITFTKKQIRAIEKLKAEAKNLNKDLQTYLKDMGMEEEKINKILGFTEKKKRPFGIMLDTKSQPEDFEPFKITEGTEKLNQGKKANKKIMVDKNDVRRFLKVPIEKVGGIIQGMTTPETFFSSRPSIRPLLDQAREIGKTINKEKEILRDHIKILVKKYPKKKLRESAGAYWHALSSSGKKAMKEMGVTIEENPKYKEMVTELQPKFNDLLKQINEARIKIGKKPIKEMEDFLAFFAQESFLQDLKNSISGESPKRKYTNLITDDLKMINARHDKPILDAAIFSHIKRKGLYDGVKLELDPLVIYERYANEALPHIHYSPLNAFIKEAMTQDLTLPDGKVLNFSEYNPRLAKELGSWSNKLIGIENLQAPKILNKAVGKLANNLTIATLYGQLRTTAIQLTALHPATVIYGPKAMLKATGKYMMRSNDAPIKESNILPIKVFDAAIGDIANSISGKLPTRIMSKAKQAGLLPMQLLDYTAREITWRAAWEKYDKLVKEGKMSKIEAIRRTDSDVIKTQASGASMELSPVQRNTLGKALTLWQTYTINHANFIAKEVLGIKNPELTPYQSAIRVIRYVTGAAVINTIFENVLGVQSPLPAPGKTIMEGLKNGDKNAAILLNTLLESSELLPVGASLKYGSHPAGPIIEYMGDISKAFAGNDIFYKDILPKAMEGDEKSLLKLYELLGKGMGIPGTVQASKYIKGRKQGKGILRSLMGEKYTGKKKRKIQRREKGRRDMSRGRPLRKG